jgi:hypothetical protein
LSFILEGLLINTFEGSLKFGEISGIQKISTRFSGSCNWRGVPHLLHLA